MNSLGLLHQLGCEGHRLGVAGTSPFKIFAPVITSRFVEMNLSRREGRFKYGYFYPNPYPYPRGIQTPSKGMAILMGMGKAQPATILYITCYIL